MDAIRKILLLIERRPGMSQAKLEELAKLPKGRISKWSGGQGEPTGAQCYAIASATGVPVEWLINGRDDHEIPTETDEAYVLRVIRDLGLSPSEVVRRLYRDEPTRDRPIASTGRVLSQRPGPHSDGPGEQDPLEQSQVRPGKGDH